MGHHRGSRARKATVVLHIKLRQDGSGYPPFAAEEVEATEVGDHRYRLETAPSFAFGLAKGDIVRVAHYGAEIWVEELVEPSGHSTVRVIALGPNSVSAPEKALEDFGCSTSKSLIDGMIVVDVPPSVDFDSVRSYLVAGREESKWDFSVGVRGDGRS
jgi:hypothetical protein